MARNKNEVSGETESQADNSAEVVVDKTATKESPIKVEINNDVDPKAKVEYIAWVDFTTIRKNEKTGEMGHGVVKRDEVITAADVPQVWIDQAESQRFLIKKSNKDAWTEKKLTRLGYTPVGNFN